MVNVLGMDNHTFAGPSPLLEKCKIQACWGDLVDSLDNGPQARLSPRRGMQCLRHSPDHPSYCQALGVSGSHLVDRLSGCQQVARRSKGGGFRHE